MKLSKRIEKTTEYILIKLKNKNLFYFLLNFIISVLVFFYILLRYKYINPEIPFWYTRLWGDSQLASKFTIYLIPLTILAVSISGLLIILFNKRYIRYLEDIIWFCVFFTNISLTASVFKIIRSSSIPYAPIINPTYISLLPAFITSFFLVYLFMPYFLDFAQREKLVTNPQVHVHPGMILKYPSARGGGFVYSLVFFVASLLFVGIHKEFVGLYLSIFMTSLLGIIDDYQNTHPTSSFRVLENPTLRLFLLLMSTIPVVISGVMIYTISNPFGGVIDLNLYELQIGNSVLPVIPIILTSLWVVWLMNVLSWSNGVDGQFPGILGIASILIAILALRFKDLETSHVQIATLAVISAGAAFGSVRFNWYPSKIMWGFGAMSAGLILASLAILSQAKITVSVLIILVPFLDAIFTVGRRLIHGKSPFKGDRGHLHHILLDRGWSVSKVALFYWFATALFGIIGLLSPERMVMQVAFIVGGVVAFSLVILNVSLGRKKSQNMEESIL